MNCNQVELLLCDYLDGSLGPADSAAVEAHLAGCPACAEAVRDARFALAVVERAAEVEPPPQLTALVLAETLSGRHGHLQDCRPARKWFSSLLAPVLQPRLVMGMALTVLSFSMMARCAGVPVRQMQASDLDPARVWATIDDSAHRVWTRSVKFYDSLRFVYEVQTRLLDWTEQQDQEARKAARGRPLEEHRLPSAGEPAPPAEQSGPRSR
jgi:anti-sigma factor RsiW